MSQTRFSRRYTFDSPLDEMWEVIPQPGWSFSTQAGGARVAAESGGKAELFVRPCSVAGDAVEITFAPGAPRSGIFSFGFIVAFEFIRIDLDLRTGTLQLFTHEFHKPQPRQSTTIDPHFRTLKVVRERDSLPALPYDGARLTVLADGGPALVQGEIDFLPESFLMIGLQGPGEMTLESFSIEGPARPRPEYVHIGMWQQKIQPTTRENVDLLLKGVAQAAEAGVQILGTPETSLTGLRPEDPELSDRGHIQGELRRFQEAVAAISGAPYTVVGYPDWVPGSSVEGALLDEVKVNAHRFVRPDGTLGPHMAKVHSCENGLWHGRNYNLQRVEGVAIALGVCHDARYSDVWTTGVMAGARLCFHLAAAGSPASIPEFLASSRGLGGPLDAFWARVNQAGGAAIINPESNRLHPDPIAAVPDDLTEKSPTYPKYSWMGEALIQKRIRLWDALGSYPLRTMRGGSHAYRHWSALMPDIVEV